MKLWGKIGLLVSGISLICIAAPAAILFLFAPGAGLPRWLLYPGLGVCALGLLVFIAFSWRLCLEVFLDILSMKTAKRGLSFGWSLALLIVFLASGGYLARRFDKSFDLTEEGIHSLSPKTKDILSSLEAPLEIRIFYKGGASDRRWLAEKDRIKAALSLYKLESPHVKAVFLDARKNAALADEYLSDLSDRERKNVFVFAVYKGGKARANEPFEEEELTGAIIKVMARKQSEILFLAGHGERDLKSESRGGLGLFSQYMEGYGFSLKEWVFSQDGQPEKPPDLAMIIGPRRPFLPGELKWLRGYLSQGGRIFLALDPGEKHGLKSFLADYGADFSDQMIFSFRSSFRTGDAMAPMGEVFDSYHSVTKRFSETRGAAAVFLKAAPLDILPGAGEKFQFFRLVKTAGGDIAAKNPGSVPKRIPQKDLRSFTIALEMRGKNPSPDEHGGGHEGHDHGDERDHGSEKHGGADSDSEKEGHKKSEAPAAGGEKKEGEPFRLMIFGDSDFLSSQMFELGINRDLAMNAVVSLLGEENLITRPKRLKGTKVTLTRAGKRGMLLLVFLLPVLCFAAGFVFWWLRRRA